MGREDHPPEALGDGPNIGPTLVEARTAKGLSLGDVEQATKIRKRYLEGLERDDYTVLPDAVYTQGFLKTYANFLGLDGTEISNRLKVHRAPRRERPTKPPPAPVQNTGERTLLLSPGGLAGAEKSRVSGATILTVVISVFVLAAIIGVLYYIGRDSLPSVASSTGQSQQAGANPSGGEPDAKPTAAEKQPEKDSQPQKSQKDPAQQDDSDSNGVKRKTPAENESAEAPPDNLQVEVRVKDSASWISVLTDGEVAFNELGEPGFSQVFEADADVSVSVGNAGSVSVEVNGQDAGVLGEPGEVLTRNFTKKTAG